MLQLHVADNTNVLLLVLNAGLLLVRSILCISEVSSTTAQKSVSSGGEFKGFSESWEN